MKLLTLSDLKHFWANAVQKIPIKISDLQDDVDMLTSHEDLHLEDLPNESPNIRFINNSPQVTWNEHVYYDPATTLISGPSYEFDDETSLTSKSKIGYTNSSNSQNTVEHIYGQTYGTTKAFFTMKYYYGSNEKNAEEDESCTINSSLVFTLDPNYDSAGADTYYDESNAYSDVSPNNENYFLGRYRPFKEIHAKDFMIVRNGWGFSLSSTIEQIGSSLGPHLSDTDIHVTASDKTTWNTVTSKANDSDVVHKTGDETSTGFKQFSNIRVNNSIKGINLDSTTTDLNNCYSDFAPYSENKGGNIQYYYCNTEAGTANISNLPEAKAFFLTSITTRLTSNSLYVKQILINSNNKTFTRYCNNSTWSTWVNETDSEYVHKSGDESITGTKTFGNGTLIVNNSIGNNVHGEIKLYGSRPGYIVADNASDGVFDNNNCGVSILLQDIGKPLHIGAYKTDSNGRVFVDNTNKNPVLSITSGLIRTSTLIPKNDTGNSSFRILSQIDYANGNTSKLLDVRFVQYDNTNATSAIYSNDDNKTSLGLSSKRWSGVYSTSYYYGNDNVEFSTKFVTTDTNQTISGEKTFSTRPLIYNSNASVQADVPNLVFKNPLVERASTTLEGEQTILFTDKNANNIASIQAKTYISGISDIILTSYSENNGVRTTGIMIRRTPTTSKLQGYSDNITDLGDTNRRWRRVYATNYYYGNDNIEFSTKFVTTDTAQTISGAKTFSNNLYVYNSDTSVNARYLILKNQNVKRGSTTETGTQFITFHDKDGGTLVSYDTNVSPTGNTQAYINVSNLDANSQRVIGGVKVIKTPTETWFIPDDDNTVSSGLSNYKWKDVQTYKVNNLAPSALSLPMTRDNAIDISSYFTNFSNSDTNSYTVNANGWIFLDTSGCNALHCFCMTTNNLTHYGSTVARGIDGLAYITFPVLENTVFKCTWYTNSTITLNKAWFIPCQGNV